MGGGTSRPQTSKISGRISQAACTSVSPSVLAPLNSDGGISQRETERIREDAALNCKVKIPGLEVGPNSILNTYLCFDLAARMLAIRTQTNDKKTSSFDFLLYLSSHPSDCRKISSSSSSSSSSSPTTQFRLSSLECKILYRYAVLTRRGDRTLSRRSLEREILPNCHKKLQTMCPDPEIKPRCMPGSKVPYILEITYRPPPTDRVPFSEPSHVRNTTLEFQGRVIAVAFQTQLSRFCLRLHCLKDLSSSLSMLESQALARMVYIGIPGRPIDEDMLNEELLKLVSLVKHVRLSRQSASSSSSGRSAGITYEVNIYPTYVSSSEFYDPLLLEYEARRPAVIEAAGKAKAKHPAGRRSPAKRAAAADQMIQLAGVELLGLVSSSDAHLHRGRYEGKFVAVKLYPAHRAEDTQRELDALQALARVPHGNVCTFVKYYERPCLAILLEWVDGVPLHTWLKTKGSPPPDRALAIALGIANGLQHIHNSGIIHRDIKSPNIVIQQDTLTPVIIDLGLGFKEDAHDDDHEGTGDDDDPDSLKTVYYPLVDRRMSVQWMSPETHERNIFSIKTDIFAFAVVIWEILSAKLPPSSVKMQYLAGKRLPIADIKAIHQESSRKLISLMEACWDQDSSLRPRTSRITWFLKSGLSTFPKVSSPAAQVAEMYQRHQLKEDSRLTLPVFKQLCSELVDQPLAHHETATVFASLRRRGRRAPSSLSGGDDETLKYAEFNQCFLAIARHGIADVLQACQQTFAGELDDRVTSWSCDTICQRLTSDLSRWRVVLKTNQVDGGSLSEALLTSLGITEKLERDQILHLHVDRSNPLFRYNSTQLRLLFEQRQLDTDFQKQLSKSLALTGPQLLDMDYQGLVAFAQGNHNTAALLHQVCKTMHQNQVVVCREWNVGSLKLSADKQGKYLQVLAVGELIELIESKNSVHWWFGKSQSSGSQGLFPSTIVVHSATAPIYSESSSFASLPPPSPLPSEISQPKVSIIESIKSRSSLKDLLALLVYGADPHVLDREGRSALHFACRENLHGLCNLLLAFGTRPTTRDVRGHLCQSYLPAEVAAEPGSSEQFSLRKMFFFLDNLRALIQIGHEGFDSSDSFWKSAIFFEVCAALNAVELSQRKIILRVPGVVQFLLSCLGALPTLDFQKSLPFVIGSALQPESTGEVSDYPLAVEKLTNSDHFDSSTIQLKRKIAGDVYECEAVIGGVRTALAAKELGALYTSMREASIFSILRPFHHPHIVRFHGIAKINVDTQGNIDRTAPPNRSFLVMEKCAKTLQQIFDEEANGGTEDGATWFTFKNIMKVAESILKALIFLTTTFPTALDHEVASVIVHRDLKPSNILLRDGTAEQTVLADFGISRVASGQTTAAFTSTHCPPEYFLKSTMTPRELNDSYDIWGFGCLLFEMFSRKPMLAHKSNSPQLFYQHLLRCYPQREVGHQLPFAQPEHCPPKEWRAIAACWAPRPSDRPSAGKLYQMLFGGDPAAAGREIGTHPNEEPQLAEFFPAHRFPLFRAGLVVRVMAQAVVPHFDVAASAVVRVTLDLQPFIEFVFEQEHSRWLARPPPSDARPLLNDDHYRWLLVWARLMMARCEQLRRMFPASDFFVNISGSDDQQRMKRRIQSPTRVYSVRAGTNQPEVIEVPPDAKISNVSAYFRYTELEARPGLTHLQTLADGLHLYCFPYAPAVSQSITASSASAPAVQQPLKGPVCKACFLAAPDPTLRFCVACGTLLVLTDGAAAISAPAPPSSTRVVQHFFERDLDTGSALSQKVLGSGAFGKVIKGKIIRTGEEVAVKLFEVSDEQMNTLIDGIHKEAELMSQLDHPNLVRMIGYMDRPRVALVLELMCSGDLFNYLHLPSNGRLRPMTAAIELQFMKDIASGIDYLHTLSMIHRDLKSPNVLLDADLRCKLSDFGFAKYREDSLERPQSVMPLSRTVGMIGTDNYNAPEVLSNQDYEQPGDMYALGVLFWEICSRQVPWASLSFGEIQDRVVKRKERLPSLSQTCQAALLVDQLTSWDASKRPSSWQVLKFLQSIDQSALPSADLPAAATSHSHTGQWDLDSWLNEIRLGEYVAVFRSQKIDSEKLLRQLTLEDLADLEIAEAHRETLLQQIALL